MLNADNVHITETGYVFIAPVGSEAPDDYDSSLSSEWVDLGYLAQGGLTKNAPIETKDITAFQNGEVIATICRSPKTTVGFGLIEHNKEAVILAAFPGVEIGPGKDEITYTDHDGGAEVALVIVEVNANGLGERTHYPRVKLTGREQIATTTDNEKVFNLTYTAYRETGGYVWKAFLETPLDDDGS
jgi:hypothetical protein